MVTSSSTHLRLTDRFELLDTLGNGSFGTVTRARVRVSGLSAAAASAAGQAPGLAPNAIVAIKSIKKSFANPADYLRLREVAFLRSLPPHESLVRAHEIFLDMSTRQLHIIMECHQMNLYQFLHQRRGVRFDARVVRGMLKQVLTGLEHIHSHGYFHRDIKPENILVTASPHSLIPVVKISDFGLVRDIHSTAAPYTTYVSTRWYRAPEIVLKTGSYGPEVDIWAFGAMAVELITLRPLFPGQNEWDQVWKMSEIMGSPELPTAHGGQWSDAGIYAERHGFLMPTAIHGTDLYTVMTANLDGSLHANANEESTMLALADFATDCLQWDANRRPTVGQALAHPYFTGRLPVAGGPHEYQSCAMSPQPSLSSLSVDDVSTRSTAGTSSSSSSSSADSGDNTFDHKVKPHLAHQYRGSKYRVRTTKDLVSKSRDQISVSPAPVSPSIMMAANKSSPALFASSFKTRQFRRSALFPEPSPASRHLEKDVEGDHIIRVADDTVDVDDNSTFCL
ncbi:kinase-like domain-containing protein [Lipomyces kononenkoae]|uniref:Kinase-like domain-containing protein n=1 Tax=Lipomyces kononenkoae TaxID=34357 RepID=A0ACC3T7Q6_LIPKO